MVYLTIATRHWLVEKKVQMTNFYKTVKMYLNLYMNF